MFVVLNRWSGGNPLHDEDISLIRSSFLGMLKFFKCFQSIQFVLLNVELVRVTFNNVFLPLQVADQVLKSTFEIFPKRAEELAEHFKQSGYPSTQF